MTGFFFSIIEYYFLGELLAQGLTLDESLFPAGRLVGLRAPGFTNPDLLLVLLFPSPSFDEFDFELPFPVCFLFLLGGL